MGPSNYLVPTDLFFPGTSSRLFLEFLIPPNEFQLKHTPHAARSKKVRFKAPYSSRPLMYIIKIKVEFSL